MSSAFIIAAFIAFFWGLVWAGLLQFTEWGRWLAIRRTWLTVVVGVGVDVLLMLCIVPLTLWLQIAAIITLSSIGIIIRSIANELKEERG